MPLNASYNDEMDIDNIPKWCLNIPISEHSIFKCGIGNSKNKHIAKDIAILNARNEVYDGIVSIKDLEDRGVIEKNKIADFIGFNISDYKEILYNQGKIKPSFICKRGKVYNN